MHDVKDDVDCAATPHSVSTMRTTAPPPPRRLTGKTIFVNKTQKFEIFFSAANFFGCVLRFPDFFCG